MDSQDFFAVLLDDTHPVLQQEYSIVRRRVFEFLCRGYMDFDFDLDKVVMIVNKKVEARKFWKGLEEGSESWKLRQRVLKKLENYVYRVPGSERTNLVMAWHAHERKNLYSNMVNGHYVPEPVSLEVIENIKQGVVKQDVGFFGRGAYFSQTPQYVLPYIRGTSEVAVLQLSWILLGRVYPVIERSRGPTTLHGQPRVHGFDSHYVLTNGTEPIASVQEEPIGDELVVFRDEIIQTSDPTSDQVYPRYLIFLKRKNSFTTLVGGRIIGVGIEPLPECPVLVWVDDKMPDVLSLIIGTQLKVPESVRVRVHHFNSTGEALAWMAKHQESLADKAMRNHFRIASNSYRKYEVEELAGKRLYELVRKDPRFQTVPFMIYCRDTKLAGFTTDDQQGDCLLRVTNNSEEALEFGGERKSILVAGSILLEV